MINNNTYAIVIPVYNCSKQLETLFFEIEKNLIELNYTLIVVDDCSSDNSWDVISKFASRSKLKIKAIRLRQNYGQHIATYCGFGFSDADFVITIDADMQHQPSDILKLIGQQQHDNAEVVYGVFEKTEHSWLRRKASELVKQSSVSASNYSGKGSSFRLIARSVIDNIVGNHRNDFIFIDEVLYWYTKNFSYVQLVHNKRMYDKSTYNIFKLISLYFKIVINYYATPLKLITWIGMITSIITFILGLKVIYMSFFHGKVIKFSFLIIVMLFSTSIILMVLGIIGQYIFKLFQKNNNKPIFQITDVLNNQP